MVLASASPARLATLRAAGIDPEVIVSGADETRVSADSSAELAQQLAELKAGLVLAGLRADRRTVVIGCDSVLEFEGGTFGKPHDAAVATARWRRMRGRAGVLHTGHAVTLADPDRPPGSWPSVGRPAATEVRFADLGDDEIEAYVATGEPLEVAGAFTLDGLGGAFVTAITGDPHNVVGISLPLLRDLIMELGLAWPDLWRS